MKDYSNIESINLQLKFVDPDGMAQPSFREVTYCPKDSLNLAIACPYHSCVDGGFNVTYQVNNAINKLETSTQINSSCQGWQDRNRINKHHCFCELTCDVIINYKNT